MTEKFHLIDGVKYREVERKAKVGEKVLAIEDDAYYSVGDILEVLSEDRWDDGDGISVRIKGKKDCGMYHYEYRVLEPITNAELASPALLDLSESNSADIALLDERTQPLTEFAKHYGGER